MDVLISSWSSCGLTNLRSAEVQMLKDVLTVKLGVPTSSSSPSPAAAPANTDTAHASESPADDSGTAPATPATDLSSAAPATENAPSEDVSVDPSPSGTSAEAEAEAVAAVLLEQPTAEPSSSMVDTMQTIPMTTGEEWPPRPWLPKSSLLRWSKPASHCCGQPVGIGVENQESNCTICAMWLCVCETSLTCWIPSLAPSLSDRSLLEIMMVWQARLWRRRVSFQRQIW